MSLILLSDNLREIYAAAHVKSCAHMQLVPDLKGAKVYHSASGWGRLWKWIFSIAALFAGPKLEADKLAKAMAKTRDAFGKHFSSAKESVKAYKTYLVKKSLGLALDENDFHKTRRKITAWHRATNPFFQASGKNKHIASLAAELLEHAGSSSGEDEIHSFSRIQHLLDLEGFLHAPLPLAAFNKLACGIELKSKEENDLKEWIAEHNKKGSPLSIRPFHAALKSFVEITKAALFVHNTEHPAEGVPDLVRLEMALSALGLEIFYKKDPLHLKWRQSLKPGTVLECSGMQVVLGEQIGKKDSKADNNLVFTLQNDPQRVVVIGINQASLAIKKRIEEEDSWCLHSPECHAISPSGDFGIYERLEGSLEEHCWATGDGPLDPKDEDLLTPIGSMLQWMVKQNMTPHLFDYKHLSFDQSGVLKYGKISLPQQFNYTAVERFVFDCANGNKTVFRHLMEQSGLAAHPYRSFFLRMLKDALHDKKKNTANLAAFEKADDPRVEDKGEELYDQIAEMKEECLKLMMEKYAIVDIKGMELLIKGEILTIYNDLRLCGTLWPGMEKDIVENVVKKALPPLRGGL